MRWGWFISLCGHIFLLALGFFAWKPSAKVLKAPDVLPVELVVIGEEDSFSEKPVPSKRPSRQKAPEKSIPKRPEPKQETTPPPPQQQQVTTTLSPQKVEDRKPQTDRPDNPSVTPQLKPKKADVKKEPKLKDEKTEKPVSKEEKKDDNFLDTLGEFETLLAEEEKKDKKNASTGQPSDTSVSSASLATLLRARMQRCWRMPSVAPEPEKLVVELDIRLRRDGSLSDEPVILNQTNIQASGDAHWIRAGEEAIRAVKRCAPYEEFPLDQYDLWSRLTIRFAPNGP